MTVEWSALGGAAAADDGGPTGRQYLQSLTAITLNRDMLHGRTRLKYEIRGGGARLFQVELPPNARVIDVQGESVERWQSHAVDGRQILDVLTATPVTSAMQALVEWEMPIGEETTFVTPRPAGVGVERQTGAMAVSAGVGVEVEAAQAEGMTPFDPREAPSELADLTQRPFAFAARYQGTAGRFIVGIRRPEGVPVNEAELTEVIGRTVWLASGKLVTYISGQISNQSADRITITIPATARLWQARLDGAPIRPQQGENASAIMMPLTRPGASDGLSRRHVELLYVEEGAAFSMLGRRSVVPPVFSLPVGRLAWGIHLPDQSRRVYALADFLRDHLEAGNWRDADDFSAATPDILGYPAASLGGPLVAVERHALAAGEAAAPIRVHASAAERLGGIIIIVALWLTASSLRKNSWSLSRRRGLAVFLVLCLILEWSFGLAMRRLIQGVMLGFIAQHLLERRPEPTPGAAGQDSPVGQG